MSYPKLVVFDLDYTLWPCWCDTHISPPIKSQVGNKSIIDKYGTTIEFYKDVPAILVHIEEHSDIVGAVSASRTHAPKLAEKMLNLLHINGRPAHSYLAHKTWGIGTKIAHFREINQITGIDYKDMVFFDDESRNRDVEQRLGVTFVLVQEEVGVTWDVFNKGIELWRKKNQE